MRRTLLPAKQTRSSEDKSYPYVLMMLTYSRVITQMDESDWQAVLRNGCLFYGWTVNMDTNEMEQAQTPGQTSIKIWQGETDHMKPSDYAPYHQR